jgi:heme/copper-type cytochrome/quinol oxidase subunit 2
MGWLAVLPTSVGNPLVPFAGADPGKLMLAFMLAMAAVGLVMTALTHAELRRSASTETKRSNVPTGVQLLVWMLIAAIITLTLIGIVGWIADFFQ